MTWCEFFNDHFWAIWWLALLVAVILPMRVKR